MSLYQYLLTNTQFISLGDLSDKFQVSKATMLRYIESLELSRYGVVLVEKRGRENFYCLDRPKRLPQIALSVEGLQQLALCRDLVNHLLPTNIKKSIETL